MGSTAAIKAVRELFKDIQQKQAKSSFYHLPDFIKDERGVMSAIETGQEWISYETRWNPNLKVLTQIAEKYDLDFISVQEEPMNGCYGEAVYTQNELHYIALDGWDRESWDNTPGFREIRELRDSLLNGLRPER